MGAYIFLGLVASFIVCIILYMVFSKKTARYQSSRSYLASVIDDQGDLLYANLVMQHDKHLLILHYKDREILIDEPLPVNKAHAYRVARKWIFSLYGSSIKGMSIESKYNIMDEARIDITFFKDIR